MQLLDSLDTIGRQQWLDTPSDTVQRAVGAALHGDAVRQRLDNFLNGSWLGHPLHPILVEAPVGAWTVGLILDGLDAFAGKSQLAPGADAATTIGLLGALASAASGLAQWQYTEGRSRRLGMAHALLNTVGTAAYSVSVIARLRGARNLGRLSALLGYSITSISAYIGGDLVYGERLGVVHIPEQPAPQDYTPVLADSDLPEGKLVRVEVAGLPILLVRRQGNIHALSATCSHLSGPLDEGKLDDCSVSCPWHNSRFALDDGRVLDGPATFPQPVYATRIRDGQIEIRQPPKDPRPSF